MLGSHFELRSCTPSLTLELNQNFGLEKVCWDQIYLDIVEEACNPERQAEVAAIVMHSGLAHVCLVTGALTITKARIDVNIPKKRTGSSHNAKGVKKFFEAIYQAILRHVDFSKVKVVLVGESLFFQILYHLDMFLTSFCICCDDSSTGCSGSPGFFKDDFFKYLQEEMVRRDDRPFIENKNKFVLCKASSGHKHALDEVFSDPAIMAKMEDTKVAREVAILNKFMRMMEVDPDRAYYGYPHVAKAQEQLAVDSLLVTDQLFRSSNVKTRKEYVNLVEEARAAGGTFVIVILLVPFAFICVLTYTVISFFRTGRVYIFSSMHLSGQQLQQVSGVAAILRYPMPEISEIEEPEDNDEDDDASTDDEYDPLRRIKEDVADMGL
jgi:protein pelota